MKRRGILRYVWPVAWLCLMLLVACGRPAPQRPSRIMGDGQRGTEPDSAQLALLELNHRLAEAADEQLRQVVLQQDGSYALYEGGVWASLQTPGDGATIQEKEECRLRLQTYRLDGTLLSDTEGTYQLGKRQLPQAVETNIEEWRHGARVRMYAPWYSAYGLHGNDAVPPYENVIIELTIE